MIEHKYHYLFIILGCLLPSNILNTFNSGFKGTKVFATNSDFLITISLEPNVLDLSYLKL